MRSAAPSSASDSCSFAMSTHVTVVPGARSQAAADARPKGCRPISYVEINSARIGTIDSDMSGRLAPMSEAGLRVHPPGLYVMFFTELWERYSFYSMMAILSLYMNDALHFDIAHVGRVYGLYQAGVYLMPVAGGLIADRWFGFTRATGI